jgi:hypothetical protein
MEAAMYVTIRTFKSLRSVPEAARRAKTGIGEILKQSPGFRGYYVFDAGNGVAGSVTMFDSRETAEAGNEKALAWIRASLIDLMEEEPVVLGGVILTSVQPTDLGASDS